jgi:ornithine cyclodeaminase/alanine dehydrogenase-like protein (mu-crystallin family)
MLFLNRQQVESLIDPDQLIDALAPAMVDLSAGTVSMPNRIAARVSDCDGLLGIMPAYVASSSTLRHGFDLQALFNELKEHERASGRPLTRGKARKVAPAGSRPI